jgi:LDH2 family malate/lactate/ureidoglycolate dehydrogenase
MPQAVTRDALTISAATLKAQLAAIFGAWGLPPDQADITAETLVRADLLGIDSHGITLIPLYRDMLASGKIVPNAEIRVARSFGATAVIDGGGGFGEAPAVRAMDLAIEKAEAFGIGAVGVRNSNHYGAAGVYALQAAARGFIGLSMTAVYKPSIVPTFGREPRMGTNPIALAAPARNNRPFLLDMATSTIAIGKLKLAQREGRTLPDGWALDKEGRFQNDAEKALEDRLMTPLGGSREMGGHKGYGLAAMVEVLCTVLSGASYAPLRPASAERFDVGHFQMAIHPEAFREAGEFEEDLDAFIDCLRATRPADPAQPVLVPGDPEHAMLERRSRDGIPLPRSLVDEVERIAKSIGAEFVLE